MLTETRPEVGLKLKVVYPSDISVLVAGLSVGERDHLPRRSASDFSRPPDSLISSYTAQQSKTAAGLLPS